MPVCNFRGGKKTWQSSYSDVQWYIKVNYMQRMNVMTGTGVELTVTIIIHQSFFSKKKLYWVSVVLSCWPPTSSSDEASDYMPCPREAEPYLIITTERELDQSFRSAIGTSSLPDTSQLCWPLGYHNTRSIHSNSFITGVSELFQPHSVNLCPALRARCIKTYGYAWCVETHKERSTKTFGLSRCQKNTGDQL